VHKVVQTAGICHANIALTGPWSSTPVSRRSSPWYFTVKRL
jgi:hypothetical protein